MKKTEMERYEDELNSLLDKYGMAGKGGLMCEQLTLGMANAISGWDGWKKR